MGNYRMAAPKVSHPESSSRSGIYIPDSRRAERERVLLTPEQEIILAQRIEKGDLEAREKLVHSNLRLVTSIARRYTGKGLLLEDLIQEGTLGLIHAAEKYDWRRGFRFSTYAVPWIRQAMLRALVNSGRNIRLPAYMVNTLKRVTHLRGKLENSLGRHPTLIELAQAMQMPEKDLADLLQRAAEPISLDLPIGEQGEQTLAELLPAEENESPDTQAFQRILQEELIRAINTLRPREQEVLRLRFGLDGHQPHTLTQIGVMMNIARECARQIEVRALEKLRSSQIGQRLREIVLPV